MVDLGSFDIEVLFDDPRGVRKHARWASEVEVHTLVT